MNGVVVAFGELMARISPPGFQRFRQCMPGSVELTFGGAEANVAVTIAALGGKARYVTALPRNAIADAALEELRGFGVDTGTVVRTDSGRMGLYFAEKGANQRPSRIVYDREHSAVSLTGAAAYDWERVFEGAVWLHLSGITPALSRHAAGATLAAAREARARGCAVSCDLNFRKNLWRWEAGVGAKELAGREMGWILEHVDMVIGNEEDAADVLGIRAGGSDAEAGRLEVERYPDVARAVCARFPNVARVATTLRESVSATHNNWAALLYEKRTDRAWFGPVRDGRLAPYEIRAIVDRVGAGDSFSGALIFALLTPELAAPETAVRFAVAASCLKHSIEGDFNLSTRAEVEALMQGSGTGRVVR